MWFLVVVVCSSVCICCADNVKTIQGNIYKDVGGELKCKVNASELNSFENNESFQVYVIGPEHENLDIYGGSCYKTSDPIEPINPNFWKKTKSKRSSYVSTIIYSVTRLGREFYTCNVYTKECNLDSAPTFNCYYRDTYGAPKPHKGVKCNFEIDVIPIRIKKKNIIILAAACVTTFLLIIGIVWSILHLINRRKRMPLHSNSLDMHYQNYPQHNEDSRPIPAQRDSQNNCVYDVPYSDENIEVMLYSKPSPKHQRMPKLKPLSQVRGTKVEEPTDAYLQNKDHITYASIKIEPIYAQPGKEHEYRNMRALKSQNADVIYNNLYHT